MDQFQPPPFLSALLVAVILILGNLLVVLMTHLCANGTIPRGGLAGIRTAATRSSDAAWEAGHVAARPVAQIGNGLAAVLAASTLTLATTVVPYLAVLGAAVVCSLGSVVTAIFVAHRAANRQIDADRERADIAKRLREAKRKRR